jgi:hypothetical protein
MDGDAYDEKVRQLGAEVEHLRRQRDTALAEVRRLSRVHDREWADHVELTQRMRRAEAQVHAVEALCAPPVDYVVVLSIRAALATAARRAENAWRLPDVSWPDAG